MTEVNNKNENFYEQKLYDIFAQMQASNNSGDFMANLFTLNELIVLYGNAGIGKTQFTIQFLINHRIPTLFYNLETKNSTIRKHITRIYGESAFSSLISPPSKENERTMFAYRLPPENCIRNDDLFFYLKEDLKVCKSKVVVIDMLQQTYPLGFLENDAISVENHLMKFKRFALENNVAVILLMHSNKENKLRGSSNFIGVPGFIFKLDVVKRNNLNISTLSLTVEKSREESENYRKYIEYSVDKDFRIIEKKDIQNLNVPQMLIDAANFLLMQRTKDENDSFIWKGTMKQLSAAANKKEDPRKFKKLLDEYKEEFKSFGITYEKYRHDGEYKFYYKE